MDSRRGSPARLLAPLALVAFAFAFFLVVATSDTGDESANGDGQRAAQREERSEEETTETSAEEEPRVPGRFYTVQTGDTLAAIAETVGVSVTRLQELNPELDPQALVSGQRIRLRE